MNYFSLFNLPLHFDIDLHALAARYQELQRQHHPDRYANASETAQLDAVSQAATINDAYQTLKDPLSRAEYLLSLHNIDVRSEQQTLRDSAFLMEQLALREELDDIEHRADAELALAALSERINTLFRTRLSQLAQELAHENWQMAADSARKLRFLVKLQRQIEQLEEKLFDA